MSPTFSLMYYCSDCEHGYRIPKSDPDRRLLSLAMPCPNKDCSDGTVEYSDPKTVLHGETCSARLLYEACMGMGFPGDQQCSPENLDALLVGSFIRSLDLTSAGTNRSIIESMVTMAADGRAHKVHFAMSTKGATVYKLEEIIDA